MAKNRINNQALIVFTKIPELGKVKTRLAKQIGVQQAFDIYYLLVKNILSEIKKLSDTDIYLYFDSANYQQFITENKLTYNTKIQQGTDIGKKMQNAFSEIFLDGYRKITLIGCDVYQLTHQLINQAFSQLNKSEIVLGPANDGGYYLVGLKQPFPEMFQLDKWSNSEVLSTTLSIIKKKNKSAKLLPKLIDIDTIEDLKQTSFYTYYQKKE